MAQPWLNDPIVGQAPRAPAAPARAPSASPRSIPGTGPRVDPYRERDQQIQEAGAARAVEDQAMQREKFDWERQQRDKELEAGVGIDGKARESEAKAAAFLIRALGSNESYEGLDIGPRSLVGQGLADTVPNLLNTLPGFIGNSPDRQVADSNQDEFIAASLRQDSGAAIPEEEMERQRRIYFPMPGDGEDVIKAKRQARRRAIEGLRQSAGILEQGAEERYRAMLVDGAAPKAAEGEDQEGLSGRTSYDPSEWRDGVYVGPGDGAPAAGADRWPGVVGEDGKPLPPGGGYGRDPETGEWSIYGEVTDDSPPLPPAGPGGGVMDYLGDATINAGAGALQGAAAGLIDLPLDVSNMVQRGVNYVEGEAGGALMDFLGFDGAADWWRRGAAGVEENLTNRTSASEMIEGISPTPEGMESSRFVSQLLGSLAIPIGPKPVPRVAAPAAGAAPNAAREIIDLGAKNKVRVMTSDVRPPTTFTGKVARATGERIPYAGTGGPRADQQAERVEAVKDLARDFGVEVGTEFLDEVADDLSRTRGGMLSTLSRQKNTVIDSIPGQLAPANVTHTLEAIEAQTRRLAGIDATEYAPVIDRLTRFGQNIASGKSLRQVEENRKLLGAMFEDASLASVKTEGQKAINAIYNPLREDMGEFIAANAGDAARASWKKANDQLAAMAGEMDDSVFSRVLRDAETTPENVAKLLFSKKPSEVRRLVGSLSADGRTRAQGAIIQRAMEQATDATGEISPDRFANAIGSLGKPLGVVFEGADLARVRGLERLLQSTKQAGVASAAPPTGVQNMPFLMGTGVGLSGGMAAIPLAAYGGIARLYESAAMRNLLAGLGMSKPGSKNESRLLERILKTATTQGQIRGPVANDVLAASPGRAAAAEQEDN